MPLVCQEKCTRLVVVHFQTQISSRNGSHRRGDLEIYGGGLILRAVTGPAFYAEGANEGQPCRTFIGSKGFQPLKPSRVASVAIGRRWRRSGRGSCQPGLYLVYLFLRVCYFLLLGRDLIFFIFQRRGACIVVRMIRIA